jgi:hypothetical protein
MKSTEATNIFIFARTRGGLVCPCYDLIYIVEVEIKAFQRRRGAKGQFALGPQFYEGAQNLKNKNK